ncbi:hypothetical protein B0T11DRAFT_142654 [Plectosphaerella cucumerina]|uniref:Uncharacterized protein n=1 Tax=Plectosphaerella cucumerina TaxID=40658 RepID=A0A8K0TAE6_9PEZI|nr:hypothetical protein B0T11DRAFT_142654 [Plectosphaerella cucumerina]
MRRPAIFTTLSLLASLLSPVAEAGDIRRRDGIHRVSKTHITVVDRLARRDVTACPVNHNLCPATLSGGCCPTAYDCATDSCYATTSAQQTCQGNVGYFQCAMEYEGGCCPVGTICRRGGRCVPPEDYTVPLQCPTNYFQCPSSLNFGCCRTGMACAASACYSTQPSTYVITRTLTTTNSDDVVMTTTERETTVSTPSPPTAAPTIGSGGGDDQFVINKYYPQVVEKVDPVITPSDSGGGLTTVQIVGIVIGIVGLLIIVIIIAWVVIRHLNKVVAVVESKQGTSKDSSGSKERPPMGQYRNSGRPTPSEVDDMSIDPLMMSPRPANRRLLSDSDSAGIGAPSPSFGTPSPGMPNGYQAVPTASHSRASHDSSNQGAAGYFDVATDNAHRVSGQSSAWASNRQSIDSQGTQSAVHGHSRHWSESSAGGTSDVHNPGWNQAYELDSTARPPELHGESVISPVDPTPSPYDPRRASDSSVVSAMTVAGAAPTRPQANLARRRSGEGRGGRSESVGQVGPAQATLSVVTEDTELIGHYGPSDRAAGQTAAGREHWGGQYQGQHQGQQYQGQPGQRGLGPYEAP